MQLAGSWMHYIHFDNLTATETLPSTYYAEVFTLLPLNIHILNKIVWQLLQHVQIKSSLLHKWAPTMSQNHNKCKYNLWQPSFKIVSLV